MWVRVKVSGEGEGMEGMRGVLARAVLGRLLLPSQDGACPHVCRTATSAATGSRRWAMNLERCASGGCGQPSRTTSSRTQRQNSARWRTSCGPESTYGHQLWQVHGISHSINGNGIRKRHTPHEPRRSHGLQFPAVAHLFGSGQQSSVLSRDRVFRL